MPGWLEMDRNYFDGFFSKTHECWLIKFLLSSFVLLGV